MRSAGDLDPKSLLSAAAVSIGAGCDRFEDDSMSTAVPCGDFELSFPSRGAGSGFSTGCSGADFSETPPAGDLDTTCLLSVAVVSCVCFEDDAISTTADCNDFEFSDTVFECR